jgi:CheY-like chemotaxis protein
MVDDHAHEDAFLASLLTERGAQVVVAKTNDEALALAGDHEFDVIVSDIRRPQDEPGSELGVRLWAAGRAIPVVHFVERVDVGAPPPVGSVGVTNDPNRLLELVHEALGPTS